MLTLRGGNLVSFLVGVEFHSSVAFGDRVVREGLLPLPCSVLVSAASLEPSICFLVSEEGVEWVLGGSPVDGLGGRLLLVLGVCFCGPKAISAGTILFSFA